MGDTESGVTDDGVLNERAGEAFAKVFWPKWLPGKFEGGEDAWEMEWVSRFYPFYLHIYDK